MELNYGLICMLVFGLATLTGGGVVFGCSFVEAMNGTELSLAFMIIGIVTILGSMVLLIPVMAGMYYHMTTMSMSWTESERDDESN